MNSRLGRYELLRLLATGGMGEVLLARREGSPEFFAVKRLLRHLSKDQGAIDRFAAEARTAARLQHPHIVRVVEFDNTEGTSFIAMEYVHGPSLRMVMETCLTRSLSVPHRVAAGWVADLLEALHYAHTRFSLVHADVSPENVLVAFTGQVKLVDFGLARAAKDAPSGRQWGRVRYAAPEVLTGERPDVRADIFAMGRILRELVTRDDSVTTGVPERLLAIADEASHPDPRQRYATAESMALALRQWLGAPTERDPLSARAVMTLLFGDDALRTVEQSMQGATWAGPSGTQQLMPIATVPVLAAAPAQEQTVVAAPPFAKPGSLVLAAVAGALAVLLAVGVWWARREPEAVPVTAMGPNDVVMPELELSIDDGDDDEDAGTAQEALAPPALNQGFLTLHARPNASVYVNGHFLGTTPLIHAPVAPGRQVVVLKAGKVSKRLVLSVSAGRHVAVNTTLSRGR